MVRGRESEEEEDEILFRYPLPGSTSTSTSRSTTASTSSAAAAGGNKGGGGGSGSGGLVPSKSTVYISNIDFSLTNSDLHTIFSTFGKVARVTVLKDRRTRQSRGVAFVLFVAREDALSAVRAMHGRVLNGRTLSASIAADNGRAAEFIRRREYRDKTRCYECGEEGHLSYDCPRNQLGAREKPKPKRARRVGQQREGRGEEGLEEEDGEDAGSFEDDNWASVVDTRGLEEKMSRRGDGPVGEKARKEKKASYFSDESDEDD